MRRNDREITDMREMLAVLDECKVCRIATIDDEGLYIVPLNYGYEYAGGKLTLFIHSAKQGRKVDAFLRHSKVAFEMDCGHRLLEAQVACENSYAFKSVIGSGVIGEVAEAGEKRRALAVLMRHQAGKDFAFDDNALQSVLVMKIEADRFTGKQR